MDERIYTEIERLGCMRLAELRVRYREVLGEDSRTAHKLHLVRRIAWRLQVQAQGDLSERARQRALEIATDADLKTQVPPHWEGHGPTAQSPPRGWGGGPDSGCRDAAAARLPGPHDGGEDPDRRLRVRGPALWFAQCGGTGRYRHPLERPVVL